MVSFEYPESKGLPIDLHHLRNQRILIRRQKESLGRLNEGLLGDDPPVTICPGRDMNSRCTWEQEEWREFQAMSAEERRPIIHKICNDRIEEVRPIAKFSHLSQFSDNLHPQYRQQIGNLSLSQML